MIKIGNKSECCGCSSCAQSCPQNCIEMKADKEGFLYPSVDTVQCIGCDLCEKVCPIFQVGQMGDNVCSTYIGYNNNLSERLASSSGGIFTMLAKYVLAQEGVIYGVAFDDAFMPQYVRIDHVDELFKLQGSKYVQSRMGTVYLQVRKDLHIGKIVLFSGVACQVAGLKSFLKKEYENLYTIDVLCHGVPSPLVWEKYINWQRKVYNSEPRQILFRKKDTGWKNYSIEIQFQNNSVYQKTFREDIYMQFFLKEICLRPSCHACHFKKLERPSDITLGDSWGVDRYMPELDDDKGTSLILVHTQTGEEMLEQILPHMKYCKVDIDKVLPATADSRKSVIPHPKRRQFFKKLYAEQDMCKIQRLLQEPFPKKVVWKMRRIYSKLREKQA